MINSLRRSSQATEFWLGAVGTFNLAVIAAIGGYTLIGIAIAVVVGAVTLVLILRWAWLLPVLVIGGFALQPALKFYISDVFGPAKDVVIVVAVAALFASLIRNRARARRSGLQLRRADPLLVLGVLAFVILYLINPAGDHGTAWADGARLVIEAFDLLLVGYLGPTPEETWRWVVITVIGIAALETVTGLAEQLIGVTRLVQGFGYQYGGQVRVLPGGQLRSFGTLDEPFSYADIVLLGLIVALHARMDPRLKAVISAFLALGVLVSFDRTVIVLMVLAFGLWLVRRQLPVAAVALVTATVIAGATYIGTMASPPGAQSVNGASVLLSVNGRVDAWGAVLSQPGNLVGGAGVGMAGSGLVRSQSSGIVAVRRFQPGVAPRVVAGGNLQNLDSSYLATLSDVGVTGLLLLLFIAVRLLALSLHACRAGSSEGWIALGAAGLFLLDSVTRTSLTGFPAGYIGLYVLGAALAASDAEAARPLRRLLRLDGRRAMPDWRATG